MAVYSRRGFIPVFTLNEPVNEFIGTGGATFGGAALVEFAVAVVAVGGLLLGGAAGSASEVSRSGTGGAVFGGTAPASFVVEYTHTGSGGLRWGGAANVGYIISERSTGGIKWGGAAANSFEGPYDSCNLPNRFFYNNTVFADYLWRTQSANFDPLKWTVSFFVYLPGAFYSSYATMWGIFPEPNSSNSEMDIEFGSNNFYSIGLWRYNVGSTETDTTNYFDLGGNVPLLTLVNFVFHWDSANADPDERLRCYMDGVRMPQLSGNWDDIPQNELAYGDTYADPIHLMLSYGESTSYVTRMSMARLVFVPGENVDPALLAAGCVPSTFPAGGYWLDFNSPATLELDSSGNDNHFTLANSSTREQIWWEVHLPEFVWSATGGLVLGGAADLQAILASVASGGLTLGGAAGIEGQFTYEYLATGGVFFGSDTAVSAVVVPTSVPGGILLGGTALANVAYSYYAAGTGGAVFGGATAVEVEVLPTSDGGVLLGGDTLYEGGYYEAFVSGSGGIRLGGHAIDILYDSIRDWVFYDMRIDQTVPFTLGIVPAVEFDGAIRPTVSFTLPIIGQQEVI